jgi:hypothetical protein
MWASSERPIVGDWSARHRAPFRGMEGNFCPLHMLLRAVTILDYRRQTRTVFAREDNANGLSPAQSIACFAPHVNPMLASVHELSKRHFSGRQVHIAGVADHKPVRLTVGQTEH